MSSLRLSETFLGMVVVGMGESLEEAARMVPAARRGHPELAWGNVVGTVVILSPREPWHRRARPPVSSAGFGP